MRAIIITRPGGPEVLDVQERPKPEPGVGQIRVRVHTSALNRADLMQREGNYPVPPGVSAEIAGMEYAGEVDALGPSTYLWKPGDRVMGIIGGAGHAEFLCVHEREAIPVPRGLSWEEAGSVPALPRSAAGRSTPFATWLADLISMAICACSRSGGGSAWLV